MGPPSPVSSRLKERGPDHQGPGKGCCYMKRTWPRKGTVPESSTWTTNQQETKNNQQTKNPIPLCH